MDNPRNRDFLAASVAEGLVWLTMPLVLARAKPKAKPTRKEGIASRLINRLTGKKTAAVAAKKESKPAAAPRSKGRAAKPAAEPSPKSRAAKPAAEPSPKGRKPEPRTPPPPRESPRAAAQPAAPAPKPQAPIAAPSLFFPRAGQSVDTLTPSFRWLYVGGATRYEIEWSRGTHFGKWHTASLVSGRTAVALDAAHALEPGAAYVWRVRGGNEAGWGPWSHAESFRSPEKR